MGSRTFPLLVDLTSPEERVLPTQAPSLGLWLLYPHFWPCLLWPQHSRPRPGVRWDTCSSFFPTISCCRLPGVGVGWGCCSGGRASICWSGKWGGTGTQQGFLQPLFSRADGILVSQRADAYGQCHWTAPRPARVVSMLRVDLRRHNTTGA